MSKSGDGKHQTWAERQDQLRRGGVPVALLIGELSQWHFGLVTWDLTWGVLFISRGFRLTKGLWAYSRTPNKYTEPHSQTIVIDMVVPLTTLREIDFLDPEVWVPYLTRGD